MRDNFGGIYFPGWVVEKWKCRSGKVSQQSSVLVEVEKGKSLLRLLPTYLCLVGADWSCLDHHFPGDICRAMGVGKIPVRRKRKLGHGTRQGRPESSLHLVREAGDEQENEPASKMAQMSTYSTVPVLFLIGLYNCVKLDEKSLPQDKNLVIIQHVYCRAPGWGTGHICC